MPLCKRFTALLTLMLMLAGTVVADEGLTMGVALDKAGRQRMLTQHMLKSYALTGMKLRIGADADLRKAAELFETQLSELTGFAANDAERAQIGKIRLLWNDLRPELDFPPELDRAGELNDLAELLLRESHQLVLLLEQRSGTVAGHLVNISGRQRMLSQRIAKSYLLETWGLGAAGLAQQYKEAVEEFQVALSELQAAKINTPEINESLAQVLKNWQIFGISNFSAKYDARVPSLVVRSMDKILGLMNETTALYAQLH